MPKKHVYISIALVLVLLAVFGILLYYRKNKLAENINTSQPSYVTSSPLPEIPEGQETPENIFYFEGFFIEKPFITNGVIMGDFVLDSDSNKTPIRVLLTTESGNFNVGTTTNDQTVFELVDASELMAFIEPNTRYELRVIPLNPDSDLGKEELNKLNQLKNDNNIEQGEYSFSPAMIRNIE